MPSVASRYAGSVKHFEHSSGSTSDELRAPVVLMVSGGADSTALLLLAATSTLDIADGRGEAHIARERLHVLHINHELRGIDAQEDEEFVRAMSAQFGIPCTVRSVNVAALAASKGENVENMGRQLRYTAAADLANKLSEQIGTPRSAARILTAHTADDRAETFFMNAIRGSGPAGLASIPRQRNRIVRPLLDRTHTELCELLRMRGIVWHEDSTNADTHYLRSYIRHELMPLVMQRNPKVVSNLTTTCDILSDEDSYLTRVTVQTYRDLMRRSSEGMIALDAGRLSALDISIARRVVRKAILSVCPAARIEARHIASILRIVAAGKGSVQVTLGVEARVEYGLLFVRFAAQTQLDTDIRVGWLDVPASVSENSVGTFVASGQHVLTARITQVPRGSDPVALARTHGLEWGERSALLDATACGIDATQGGRLWVDTASQGDVICPLGMHGQSKKLSDLLNEAKIPAPDRAQILIVRISPTDRIVWVAGIRADERACCTPSTAQLLELNIATSNELSKNKSSL